MDTYPDVLFDTCKRYKVEGSTFHTQYDRCKYCIQYPLCQKWYDLDLLRKGGDRNEPLSLPYPSLPLLTVLN